MTRRDRATPEAARSPLVELETELRALDRKRQALLRDESAKERRFEPPTSINPGAWTELERTVSFEQAA
jgi:hypothetical protein